MNIAMLLEMAAEGDPERVVLGSRDGGIGAAELLERARRAAVYFEKSGADVVGYFGFELRRAPVALFGAGAGGGPVLRRSTIERPTSNCGASSGASPAV